MLEQMRKSSQSLLIYVLFGIVIAVFIINFGPQSRGGSCESSLANDHYAAKVAGQIISTSDFHYGFLVAGGAQYPAQVAKQQRLKETVMDKLIERELLASEAERLGYSVDEDQVVDEIGESKLIGLGYPRTVSRMQKDGKFNYEAFKNFVQFELGVTPKSFIEEQRKELLAARVRDLLRAGVTVSANEVKADYLRKNQQVNLEYVRFSARGAEDATPATPAEIAAYAAKNEAALKSLYDERKFIYEKVPKELKLQQLVIKVAADAKPDVEKAAFKKVQELAARIKKGESFTDVARASTEEPTAKARGGELGWRGRGATNIPGDDEKKLFDAKPGELVGPLKGAAGVYLTKVEDAREGTIPFDKVKLELAEDKLRTERSSAEAKTRADAALALAKADSTKTLKDLFPPPPEAKDDADKSKAEADKLSGTPAAPRAEETGLFSPRGTRQGAMIEGIGVSNPLARAAFALTPAAPIAGPFEVAGSWLIVRLKERKDPDLGEYEKKKGELLHDAELTRWNQVLTDWTRARCLEAKEAKRILINRDQLRYEDSAEPPPYEPCMGQHQMGG